MLFSLVLPMHTRPRLYDYIAFPFRAFTIDVWICLGGIIALLFAQCAERTFKSIQVEVELSYGR